MKNYDELNKVIVTSQEEMDEIPSDFQGKIYIKAGCRICVKQRYYWSVVAMENASVVAWGNASVEAMENASIEATENASVEARGNTSVEAWGNASVEAMENASVEAWGNTSVVARGNASVVARGNASVEAMENASVEAWGNTSVVARGNTSVVARGNASVEASANSQIVDRTINGKIKISDNARIEYMPKAIYEFMDFYDIKHDKKKATFYKAVCKDENGYYSSYDNSFRYNIGEIIKERCDDNVTNTCSFGIHIAHLNWALNFGSDFTNLAILEVETDIDKIVIPTDTDGKVRTSEIKVIREVLLEECGIYGKILAKRKQNN